MKKFISHALATVVMAGTAVIAAAPTASAVEWVPCQGGPTEVCYEETGRTDVVYNILNVGPAASVHVADVAAYLDIYRVPTGTGDEGIQIPCITPIVNGVEQDTCGQIGLTRVSRRELVPQTSVDAQLVKVDGFLATVYVCTARLTAKVDEIGANGVPMLSVCSETAPTTWLHSPDEPWLGTWTR